MASRLIGIGYTFVKQCFYACIAVVLSFLHVPDARADHAQALFISSYHPAFHSFMRQVEGIKDGLVKEVHGAEEITLDIEFMDAKRFPGAANVESFKSRLASKLKGQPAPDVLLVGDDLAFKFAQAERDKLFAGIPVVFLGVNNIAMALEMNDDPQFTGVVEKASFGPTLDLAKSLISEGGKIYVITDHTRTGRINLEEFLKTDEYQRHEEFIELLSLGTLTYDNLAMRLRKIESGSVINLLSAFKDMAGETRAEHEIARLLNQNASVPFVHAWESHLGLGSLGGVVISHYEQGRRAGELASAILNGQTPAEIAVVGSSPNKLVIDHNVMEAFGFDKNQFPKDTEYLNAPETLLGEYREYLIVGGVFLALQSGIIFLLFVLNRRRKAAETSMRESQRRFRDFANASSDWFWEMDDQLRFSYFSDRFEEVTGVPPVKLLGKTRQETGIPGVDTALWEAHLKTLENHRPFREFTHPRDKNGQTVWVAISGEPVFDASGRFLGYRGTGADVTERRAADEALREALKNTEQANQSKSNFLAMMSHEFRTPLNAILGFSDILRQQVFGPLGNDQYKEYATDIHDSGKHMLALVNDVLDISAVEAGKREFEEEELEIVHIFEECARSMRQYAIDRNVSVEVKVDDSVPMLISDRRAVMQILYNLLSNAIKYTPSGGHVELISFAREKELLVQVRDTGVGISPNQLPNITEAFTRSHSDPLIAQEEGTGLGLAIVQSLVEELGAKVSFESEIGKGTTATITFPINLAPLSLPNEI